MARAVMAAARVGGGGDQCDVDPFVEDRVCGLVGLVQRVVEGRLGVQRRAAATVTLSTGQQ